MKKLTTRQKFERLAKREKLNLDTVYEMTRNGRRMVYLEPTETAWQWFQAGRRSK